MSQYHSLIDGTNALPSIGCLYLIVEQLIRDSLVSANSRTHLPYTSLRNAVFKAR